MGANSPSGRGQVDAIPLELPLLLLLLLFLLLLLLVRVQRPVTSGQWRAEEAEGAEEAEEGGQRAGGRPTVMRRGRMRDFDELRMENSQQRAHLPFWGFLAAWVELRGEGKTSFGLRLSEAQLSCRLTPGGQGQGGGVCASSVQAGLAGGLSSAAWPRSPPVGVSLLRVGASGNRLDGSAWASGPSNTGVCICP